MKFIIGKKITMTQRFAEDGTAVPVTVVAAGPCAVTQIKTAEKDGYEAVQIGFGRKKKPAKPQRGHLKGLDSFQYLREFRLLEPATIKRGDVITVPIFVVGDQVTVVAISKGRGFQGVVKRHGFSGSKATHGNKDQLRAPGSIGATDAARVFKGRKMAGQMGNQRVTVAHLKIVEIDAEKNLIYIRGAVPGARNSLVLVSADGELKLSKSTESSQTVASDEAKQTDAEAEQAVSSESVVLAEEKPSSEKKDYNKQEAKA